MSLKRVRLKTVTDANRPDTERPEVERPESLLHMDNSREKQAAAAAEKRAARTMDLRGQTITLVVAVALFGAYLVLPHAGSARGVQVLTGHAGEVEISIVEYVFVTLMTLGVGVLSTLTLITRRAVFGLAGWMMSTVAFAVSLFMFWVRGTQEYGLGLGAICGVVACGLSFIAYCLVALRRSPEQQQAQERARAAAGTMDEVGQVHNRIRATVDPGSNPLLIDDRRQQAVARHRRNQGGNSASGSTGSKGVTGDK